MALIEKEIDLSAITDIGTAVLCAGKFAQHIEVILKLRSAYFAIAELYKILIPIISALVELDLKIGEINLYLNMEGLVAKLLHLDAYMDDVHPCLLEMIWPLDIPSGDFTLDVDASLHIDLNEYLSSDNVLSDILNFFEKAIGLLCDVADAATFAALDAINLLIKKVRFADLITADARIYNCLIDACPQYRDRVISNSFLYDKQGYFNIPININSGEIMIPLVKLNSKNNSKTFGVLMDIEYRYENYKFAKRRAMTDAESLMKKAGISDIYNPFSRLL